ncbi:MAG: hypothetical protein MSS28_05175 [Tenericutes bacterium]|nr:hypothetical protein [Mycoplasmatota bacterium]
MEVKKSKKHIFIIIGVVILLLLVPIIYGVVKDLKQEDTLKKELDTLYEVTNKEPIDRNEVNKILDRTVTTSSDYKKVEIAYKKYTRNCFSILTDIMDVLEDNRLVEVLTAENYQQDGKDFTETKKYLKETKEKLQRVIKNYNEYFTEEKAMSYLDKNLDSYYQDFYKDEVVGNLDKTKEDDEVISSINDLITLIDQETDVINFLVTNKDAWTIEDSAISFTTDDLIDAYNNLIGKISD